MTLLPGCSRRDGRLAESGAVTIDGKALESGVIRFQPVEMTKATGSGTSVRDGKYSIAADHGLYDRGTRLGLGGFGTLGARGPKARLLGGAALQTTRKPTSNTRCQGQ